MREQAAEAQCVYCKTIQPMSELRTMPSGLVACADIFACDKRVTSTGN